MANTIRDVIADVVTAIEALTPTSDATHTFICMSDYPAAGVSDVPSAVRLRRVFIDVVGMEDLHHLAGTRTIYLVTLALTLLHPWRKHRSDEAEKRRAEDVAMLRDCMVLRRPGRTNGLRLWESDGAMDRTIEEETSITRLTFTGTAALVQTVTPA